MGALTPARRRALEVLADVHPRAGRYSNSTGRSEQGVARVYHQTADWLIEQGFVERHGAGMAKLSLTAAGLDACRDAGIPVSKMSATIPADTGGEDADTLPAGPPIEARP